MASLAPASGTEVFTLKYPLWLMRLLAVFPLSGLVGADHFLVGSNLTGAAKALINIITLGSWYFYDVVYVLSSDDLLKVGYTMPFFENIEFGKGMVTETLMPGMEQTVGNISKVLFILSMLTVAFYTWIASSHTTGGLRTVFTWTAFVSGGIGLLMLLISLYSLYVKLKSNVTNLTSLTSNLTSIRSFLPNPAIPKTSLLTAQKGGGRKIASLQEIAEEMLDTRKSNELPSESLLFMGILLTIALGGISYAGFYYQKQSKAKKDETSRISTDTRTELSKTLSDTDGI